MNYVQSQRAEYDGETDRIGLKRDARELLYEDGNRLKLIGAQVIAVLLLMLTMAAASLAGYLNEVGVLEIKVAIINFAEVIVILLAVLPVMLGALNMTYRMYSGEKVYTSDVFGAFRRLPRTLTVIIAMIIPELLIVAGCVWVSNMNAYLATLVIQSPAANILTWLCVSGVAAILFIGAAVVAIRLYFLPSLIMRGDMSVREAWARALAASHGRMREIIMFNLSFIGWLALSFCTIGVLYILHTMPYYTVSYIIYTDHVINLTEDRTNG